MNKVTKIAMGVVFASMVIGVTTADKASAATQATPSQYAFKQITQGDYNTLIKQFNVLEGKSFKQWDYNDDVKLIQNALSYLGYQPGYADGILGPRSIKALNAFQYDHSSKVTKGFEINSFYAIRYALQVNSPKNSQQNISQQNNIPNTYVQPTNNFPVAKPVTSQNPVSTVVSGNAYVADHAFGVSQSDLDMLAHIVYGEARGESFEGKVAVAAVVLNRTKSPLFPSTISGVIYDPWAFTCLNDGQYYLTPDAQAYQAAQAAIKGWDPTNGALYYWNPVTATSPWVWSRPITKTIGKHVFAV